MKPKASTFLLCFWLGLTLLLTYITTYPYDLLSDLDFTDIHNEILPAFWGFNWHLTHLITGDFDQLFTGNLFYPLEDSVLFNVNLLSTAILSIPLFWITGDAYLCYEASIFASFILCSLGMYLLARQLKLEVSAAILAALVFSFSEYRNGTFTYGHFAAMQWMPFTLLFIHKYFDRKKRVHLYWAAVFFGLQTTACETYFILFSLFLLVFVVVLGIQKNILRLKSFYRDAAIPFLLALIPAAINYFPYWQISHNYGFKRSIATQTLYGLPLSSFLSAPGSYILQPFTDWFGSSIGGSYPVRFTALMLFLTAIVILRKKVSSLPWIRKLDIFLIAAGALTALAWLFKPGISEYALHRLPFLHDNPEVVPTAILSPFFLVITLRLCLSRFARSVVAGLMPHKTFFLYTTLALFAFLVSLGPAIKTHGQEYLMANPLGIFLYFTFPGLSAIRSISRMGGLIPLGMGICAGISFMILKNRIASISGKGLLSFLVFALLLIETFPTKGINAPYRLQNRVIPPEYVWLKNDAPEGPLQEWPSPCFTCDVDYMRWSIYHGKPSVNGWASYQWDGHKKMNLMTDLSAPESLRSLYALGPRYLFVHKQESAFPAWAGDRLGEFQLIERFENTMIYDNENARPQFLPENYWEKFSISSQPAGGNSWNLLLTFASPDKHFVSRKKKVLPIEIRWEDGSVQHSEITFYPTLWRDGDTYSQIIKHAGGKIIHIRLGDQIPG